MKILTVFFREKVLGFGLVLSVFGEGLVMELPDFFNQKIRGLQDNDWRNFGSYLLPSRHLWVRLPLGRSDRCGVHF